MNNADMPAMPLDDSEQWLDATNPKLGTYFATGLTKREHFAGLAMQGLCSGCDSRGCWIYDAGITATAAIEYADALLAELNKTGE
jgi:hypothetical protein